MTHYASGLAELTALAARVRGARHGGTRGRGVVSAVVDFTIEVEGGTKPACVAQAIYRYYA